ncbi:hypothetical protein PR048_024840 [Dryococelus australis]|uniref:Mutator-like transposase domain-containing protein n=1 Tax=Dryococelus australis TaxID=614101 RepID=A0ABQ9GPN3_9NEOP|nr:hypothetical protein PR048_024840 [Dryococelus australis]
MKSAKEETVTQNNDRDVTVALDGPVDTGKVIDVYILSKHCTCKDKLKGKHEEACSANHKGTSGGTEVSGAVKFFNRSLPQYNVLRYTNYLGDWDCKGHKAVLQTAPYGDKSIKIRMLGTCTEEDGYQIKKFENQIARKET